MIDCAFPGDVILSGAADRSFVCAGPWRRPNDLWPGSARMAAGHAEAEYRSFGRHDFGVAGRAAQRPPDDIVGVVCNAQPRRALPLRTFSFLETTRG